MKIKHLFIFSLVSFSFLTESHAVVPLWTFTPLNPTNISVPANTSATIRYNITNQSPKAHTLVMLPINGVVQITSDRNSCGNPFTLPTKGSSCILSLQIVGSLLIKSVTTGPVVCQQGSNSECYRPAAANNLNIVLAPPIPLPANCVNTGNNNTACQITTNNETNFGFTNMTYALCRSAQCNYNGVQTTVNCSCLLIKSFQGLYSSSISPNNYNTSKPVGNKVTSTYSMVNSSGETPTNCPSGPFANCFGASCTVNGNTVTCVCPVSIGPYIAPQANCNLTNKIWSATSTTSFPSIEGAMLYMYNTFFGGNRPAIINGK